MAKLIKHVTIFVVIGLTVIALAVLGTVNALGLQIGQLAQLAQSGAAKEVDRSQPVLLESIQEVGQLHAAVGNFHDVIDVEEDVTWLPGFIAGRRTIFVAAGTVNAYVDLSGMTSEDLALSADGKSATVRLPDPQLDKPNLDLERSYFAHQDRGIVDRVADAIEAPEQVEFHKLAETRMAKAAETAELGKQATDNTKAMLIGMFGSLGIDVVFLEEDASE